MELLAAFSYEPVSHGSSFVKIPMAFFSMSRSSVMRASFRRRRISSSCSFGVMAAVPSGFVPNSRTHRHSILGATPSSLATWDVLSSLCSASVLLS